ncbi:MAG: B12-binding domain-containing radical SAM protein [Pseudomonadales bacterium]|nr:B12-binding domain-containing radical SAM protein [Pseudomonadales bacterium]
MARIAIVKLFTGLNLAPAQLSGELQRAGHASQIIYFKDHHIVPYEEKDNYAITDYPGIFLAADGSKKVWNCYKPFNEKENKALIQTLKDFNPDAIGLSVISGVLNEAKYVTELIKAHFDVPVIWGGPGPTLEPDRCIAMTDMICINEGEEVIVELANRLDAGEDITRIDGTWAKDTHGDIIKNPERPLLNLDDIAIPDWNLENYVHINAFRGARKGIYPNNLGQEYPIMTQRGCPFSCSFCIESKYQEMFGKKDSLRRRNIDVVIEELLWAKNNLDIKSILFYDDVFTVHPRWLDEFLPRYKAEIGLPFWCYTYPTTHTPELLAKLKDAGMMSITMGVQSGSTRILKEYFNRPTAEHRVIAAAKEIVDLGPEVKGFFDLITKIPFETEEDLKATFNLLLDLPVEFKTVGFGEMTNFPEYSFTKKVDENPDLIAKHDQELSQDIYDYYHKLYLLTRSSMPREQLRKIGDDPQYRENHKLLDPFMTDEKYMSFTGISF